MVYNKVIFVWKMQDKKKKKKKRKKKKKKKKKKSECGLRVDAYSRCEREGKRE